jgi:hypothetical protein
MGGFSAAWAKPICTAKVQIFPQTEEYPLLVDI